MPSVGMRRTTRVFGVVKGVDGARVLRSGRRLWSGSGDVKGRKPKCVDDDWLSLIKTNNGDGGDLDHNNHGCAYYTIPKQDDLSPEVPELKLVEAVDSGVERSFDKMFGILYVRKRKRSAMGNFDYAAPLESPTEYRMFGRQFVRRQRRKRRFENSDGAQNVDSQCGFVCENMVRVAMDSSLCRTQGAVFLYAVLMYMTKTRLRLAELSAFLMSEPINSVFSSFGIGVFGTPVKRLGSCQIFGATNFLPMFSVDFSAIPHCYMYMHSCMLLKYKCQPLAFVDSSIDEHTRDVIMINVKKNHFEGGVMSVSSEKYILDKDPQSDHFENQQVQHPSVRASKLAGRNILYRNGSSSRGTQKKRKRSIRRKARNPSLIGTYKPNAPIGSGLMSFQRHGLPFYSIVSNSNSKIRDIFARDLKKENSTMVSSQREIDSSRCCSNILIIESDKCYREEGANVLLELSPAGEWLLVVKKNGSTRFIHKAEKVMRLPSSNRITHATVWNIDSSWKLEFPSRQDWAVFKDLYRECSERNTPASSVKVIPVPGVCEVPGYGDSCSVPFIKPDSYISINGDEVSRAMAKRTAIYDMDSDDEEWLNKSNSNDFSANEVHDHVSEDNFELMIDAFEKVFYCNPHESSIDEKAAVNLCQNLGRKEAVEALYGYWVKKRKQRKAPLLRVFQGQVKKPPLIPKPHLRKKRSFKRQPSRLGKGKHLELRRAMTARQDAMEEQKAERRLEEAKASANQLTEIAISKRQRAQFLVENADLSTYKATIAFRIAEAARVAESTNDAGAHFLD